MHAKGYWPTRQKWHPDYHLNLFTKTTSQMFLELEVPIILGVKNPLLNIIVDLFLSNPMPVQGFKLSEAFFTRQEVLRKLGSSIDG